MIESYGTENSRSCARNRAAVPTSTRRLPRLRLAPTVYKPKKRPMTLCIPRSYDRKNRPLTLPYRICESSAFSKNSRSDSMSIESKDRARFFSTKQTRSRLSSARSITVHMDNRIPRPTFPFHVRLLQTTFPKLVKRDNPPFRPNYYSAECCRLVPSSFMPVITPKPRD